MPRSRWHCGVPADATAFPRACLATASSPRCCPVPTCWPSPCTFPMPMRSATVAPAIRCRSPRCWRPRPCRCTGNCMREGGRRRPSSSSARFRIRCSTHSPPAASAGAVVAVEQRAPVRAVAADPRLALRQWLLQRARPADRSVRTMLGMAAAGTGGAGLESDPTAGRRKRPRPGLSRTGEKMERRNPRPSGLLPCCLLPLLALSSRAADEAPVPPQVGGFPSPHAGQQPPRRGGRPAAAPRQDRGHELVRPLHARTAGTGAVAEGGRQGRAGSDRGEHGRAARGRGRLRSPQRQARPGIRVRWPGRNRQALWRERRAAHAGARPRRPHCRDPPRLFGKFAAGFHAGNHRPAAGRGTQAAGPHGVWS